MPVNHLSRMVARLDSIINESRRSLPFIHKRLSILIENKDYESALKCSKAMTVKLTHLTRDQKWRDDLQARVENETFNPDDSAV